LPTRSLTNRYGWLAAELVETNTPTNSRARLPTRSLTLTNRYGWLAAELVETNIAPVVLNLEGGYNPSACCMAASEVIAGLTRTVSSAQFLDAMGVAASTRTGSNAPPFGKGADTTAASASKHAGSRRGGAARGSAQSTSPPYTHRGVQLVGPPSDVVDAVHAAAMMHADPSWNKASKTRSKHDAGRRGKK
jgi:hypothetical protein